MGPGVVWSDAARDDLREIAAYIARDQPTRARAFVLRLIDHAEGKIGAFPRIGRVVPEADDENLREVLFPPYRIIYELTAAEARPVILRVWHAARGEPDLPSSE